MHQGQEPGFLRFSPILYGGDYYPEQWIQEEGTTENAIWQDDLRFMRKANVNFVTLGVFSWAALQPAETTFTFEWLDTIMDLLEESQIFVCLGTATALALRRLP
jgi:beta-galactosidase